MNDKYFVFIGKKYYGPLTEEDVRKLIKQNKISVSNYIYDVNLKYVFMIGEHKNFTDLLPERPSDTLLKSHYILIKNNKLTDVFSKQELQKEIESSKISIYEYVLIPKKNEIVKIRDLEELKDSFPTPPLESPTDTDGKKNIILVKDATLGELVPELARRFPRAPFSAPTRIEFKGNSYIGNCSVIGEGGCFLELRNNNFQVGDKLQLSIVSELMHLEINVTAEVTSMVKEYKSGIGVKFLDLKDSDREKIVQFIDRYIEQVQF